MNGFLNISSTSFGECLKPEGHRTLSRSKEDCSHIPGGSFSWPHFLEEVLVLCIKSLKKWPTSLENPMDEEPGGLQSMGSLRVRHDWATSLSLFTFLHWRRKWQPTPVFLPGESQGWRSLVAVIYGVAQSRTRLKWLSSSNSSIWKDVQHLNVRKMQTKTTVHWQYFGDKRRPFGWLVLFFFPTSLLIRPTLSFPYCLHKFLLHLSLFLPCK